MSLKLGKPKMPPSEPRKDKQRETREAMVQDADKTEGKDRDLVPAPFRAWRRRTRERAAKAAWFDNREPREFAGLFVCGADKGTDPDPACGAGSTMTEQTSCSSAETIHR